MRSTSASDEPIKIGIAEAVNEKKRTAWNQIRQRRGVARGGSVSSAVTGSVAFIAL